MRALALVTVAALSGWLAGCEQPRQAAVPAATAPGGPTYTFRLAPGRNLVGCSRLDAALSREQTVTVVGSQAEFRSAGGVNGTAQQIRPNVYGTDFSLANVRLNVVADLSQPVKTLTVTERNAGCRWSGEAR